MIRRLFQIQALVLGVAAPSACTVDLGECNDPVARRVVYDPDGFPAYEGQALMAVSCGNVLYCHSSAASPEFRFGATVHLDFDVQLTLDDTPEEAARLRQAHDNVLAFRDDIYCEVEADRMPPFGEATLVAHEEVPRYRDAEGVRLPFVDSFEGLDILRGWLACDAPLIERTTPHPAGVTPVGDVVPRLRN